MVAQILKDKIVATNVSLVVAPGSRQVMQNIDKSGHMGCLISSGARIDQAACGFCIGNSQSPSTKGISLRTSNRNFEGRSGTKDAQVYLVSCETAAASAITGKITDPRKFGMACPKISSPKKFVIDDKMFVFPKSIKDETKVEIFRGPNIGAPPTNSPFPESIKGVATIKLGDKITTDHIIPAGARMKYRSNVPKYSEFVFETVDAGFAGRAKQNRDVGMHNIIVGGASYGEGSSREHAAICPMFLGVKIVLAKSFQRIHTDNLINFGILPLTFKNERDYDSISQSDELEIADSHKSVAEGRPLVLKNKTKNMDIEVVYNLTERQRQMILAGGSLSLQKEKSKN